MTAAILSSACMFAAALVSPAHADDGLTIVSVNAWGLPTLSPDMPRRMDRLRTWVDGQDADVVGFQELWNGALPHVGSGLTMSRRGGDDGLAMLSRHDLQDVEVRRFDRARSFDALKRKGVLRARLVREGTPDVWIFVTHMQAGYGAANARVREHQVGQLTAWLAATEGPAVVLGDFNVDEQHPEDAPFLALLAAAGLTDVAQDIGAADPTYPGDGRRYDRVYVRGGAGWTLHADAAQVLRWGTAEQSDRLSDHLPVRVHLRLIEAAATADVGPNPMPGG